MCYNKTIRNRYRVALYPRVSSHEQVDGYSIGEQIERLTKYCEAMDWDIFKIYTDPGYSGGSMDRPGLQAMLSDVRDGLVDKVVVYKLDRLSRSQKDTMMLIEDEFLAHGVDFVSMSENFDTSTSFGRAMIGILAVFAQLERENIKERTIIGKEARAKEGKWHGSKFVPLGYDYNIALDLLEINEYEAMQVREIFDLFLEGKPLRTIETILIEKGYAHRFGTWTCKTMKHVLASKAYIGYLKYRDEYYKAEHVPIISEETFNKAQDLLAQRAEQFKEFNRRPDAQTTLLGGMIFCKHCGGRYAKHLGGSTKYGKLYYYACYSRSKKVKRMIKDPNCKNKYWRTEKLEELVLNEIKKLSIDPGYIETLRNAKPIDDKPDKIKIIQDEIENIDNQISRFMDLYGIGKFTIDQVSQKVDPLNDRKMSLEKELKKLNEERGKIDDEKLFEIINSFEDVIERGVLDEIRLLINSLIRFVEIDEDDVYIHWKFL